MYNEVIDSKNKFWRKSFFARSSLESSGVWWQVFTWCISWLKYPATPVLTAINSMVMNHCNIQQVLKFISKPNEQKLCHTIYCASLCVQETCWLHFLLVLVLDWCALYEIHFVKEWLSFTYNIRTVSWNTVLTGFCIPLCFKLQTCREWPAKYKDMMLSVMNLSNWRYLLWNKHLLCAFSYLWLFYCKQKHCFLASSVQRGWTIPKNMFSLCVL